MKILIIYSAILCSFAWSEENSVTVEPSKKPLYEFGIFGGSGLIPDYPASDQSRIRYIALPYGRYRGPILRVDEDDGVGTRILRKKLYGLDLSGGGSFPARSSDNRARANMPNLDWLGEIGPRIYYRTIDDESMRLTFSLPIRFAFSTDFTYLRPQGVVIAPSWSWQKYSFLTEKFDIFIAGSLSWTSLELANYFYEVKPEYQTTLRPSYKARPGYLGSGIFVGGSYYWTRWSLGGGIRYSNHHGSANEDSPLFKRNENWMYVIGFSYRFLESEKLGFK